MKQLICQYFFDVYIAQPPSRPAPAPADFSPTPNCVTTAGNISSVIHVPRQKTLKLTSHHEQALAATPVKMLHVQHDETAHLLIKEREYISEARCSCNDIPASIRITDGSCISLQLPKATTKLEHASMKLRWPQPATSAHALT